MVYLFALSIFYFTNWTNLKASNSFETNANLLEERFSATLDAESDPQPVLEDWMLELSAFNINSSELAITLESWMVNTSDFSTREFAINK